LVDLPKNSWKSSLKQLKIEVTLVRMTSEGELKILIFFLFIWMPSLLWAAPPWEVEIAFPKLVFDQPVDLQSPQDGTNRLFVVERKGRILVFSNNPSTTKYNVFLDIQNEVNSRGGEEGLLGLVFHPEFFKNGYFFLNYTSKKPKKTVISRYQVDPKNPNQILPQSGKKNNRN